MVSERIRKYYDNLRLEDADIVLHFGWGGGYPCEILRRRAKPGARVIVFEPDEASFRQSLADSATRSILDDARFQFVTGPNMCEFFDDWGLGECQETDQFLWVDWPAALLEHNSTADTLKRQFRAHLRDRAGNLLTHFRNGPLYFENALRNFEYQEAADAGRLFRRFHKIPLVIVSAGPSLDRNIEHLRGYEDRCFILAVDTALRPLLAAGITPHAVIIADPSELNAKHVAGVVPESVYLIAEQAVHLPALRAAKRHFLFGLGVFPDSLFTKFGFGKSRLAAWGSVATTALDLACRMGADPIMFAGQDFAYSWDRDYASNTIYHGKTFVVTQAPVVRSRDIFGNEIYTTENFIAYRDFFARRMKHARGVRFINATEGGILTGPAELLPLREALRQCAVERVDASGRLRACYRPSRITKDALEHLRSVLASRQAGCDCLREFLELTAKEHLLRKNDIEIENKISWGSALLETALS